MTPTQRSLQRLRRDGWLAAVVEHWNPHAHVRQDLWGFLDILGAREGELIGIQATSRSNVASRVTKTREHPNFPIVASTGMRIVVWGWSKMASGRYELREVELCGNGTPPRSIAVSRT
jgi:hypothetical protein